MTPAPPDGFPSGVPRPLPGPRFTGLNSFRLERVGSTNLWIKDHLFRLSPLLPLRVSADEQTAGRGRSDRVWFSTPHRSLAASFAVNGENPAVLPFLSLTAGVAATDAFTRLGLQGTVLKWPNDLLAAGKKIAGILSETVIRGDSWLAILGFGLNLSQGPDDFPAEVATRATSFRLQGVRAPGPEEALEVLTDCLFARLETLMARGEAPIIAAAEAASAPLRGQPILFHTGEATVTGTFRGYAPDGALVLESADHRRTAYYHGEIDIPKPGMNAPGEAT